MSSRASIPNDDHTTSGTPFRIIPVLILMTWGIGSFASMSPAVALPIAEARHLLARTGFGLPRPDEIMALADMSRDQAVDHILRGLLSTPSTEKPAWVDEPMPDWKVRKNWSRARKRAFNKTNRERWRLLQRWWADEMLATSSPLTERLVLFWHNHFTSSFDAVKWVPYLYAQNAVFRRHAAGNFRDLLMAMVTDPAMLFYLDGRRNRAKKPNENFARELLELFTMGEGKGYRERDIREVARALSGWGVDTVTAKAVFRAKHHDEGQKEFLGQRGAFGAQEVIDVILDHDRPAQYMAETFYDAFIGGMRHAPTVNAAAKAFRQTDYSVHVLLRTLLISPAFWDLQTRGTQIKSPVDMVMGLARFTNWQGKTKTLVSRMNAMGQRLFRPPNVKGWPGGAAWISTSSLASRNGFVYAMTRYWAAAARSGTGGMNVMTATAVAGEMSELMTMAHQRPAETAAIVLAVPPVSNISYEKLSPAAYLTALFRDPAFQMK